MLFCFSEASQAYSIITQLKHNTSRLFKDSRASKRFLKYFITLEIKPLWSANEEVKAIF